MKCFVALCSETAAILEMVGTTGCNSNIMINSIRSIAIAFLPIGSSPITLMSLVLILRYPDYGHHEQMTDSKDNLPTIKSRSTRSPSLKSNSIFLIHLLFSIPFHSVLINQIYNHGSPSSSLLPLPEEQALHQVKVLSWCARVKD